MGDKTKGTEFGVNWEIDCTNVDPIIIKVYQVENSEIGETIKYELSWADPIFGYDCIDISNVNEILDKLIEKYKVQ